MIASTFRIAFTATCLVATSTAARAEDKKITIPQSMIGEVDQDGTAIADLFANLCLSRFPDEAALKAGLDEKHLEALPPDAIKRYLHDDPGRGWLLKTDSQPYVVTVENPPFNGCAVRRLYATAPKYRMAFELMVKLWATSKNLSDPQDQPEQTINQNGVKITANMSTIAGPDGKPKRNFMALLTSYPNGQSEVRLVQQIFQK